ncbi:MAG: chloride channel protein [Cyanobacteria bacterium P01_E01_bin.6]
MRVSSIYNQLRQMSLRPKQIAIFEACVIGLVSGLAAVLLKQGAEWMENWRIAIASQPGQLWFLPLIGVIGGMVAGFLVEQLSPEARGSGIPQVKAGLASFPVVLNLRVALVKLLSVVLVMGSGLSLGRQGPTVHIGAALAAQFNQWIPTSPEYRRQLLAAGAAAGLAAGFNAPIAGVLFVVEELLHDFSGLTLGTAILASFIGAVVARLLGDQGLSLNSSIADSLTSVSLQDIPFLAIVGLLAGIFGALFSRSVFTSVSVNHRLLQLRLPWKVGLAGLITGLVMMVLPMTFWENTGLPTFLKDENLGWHIALLAFTVKFSLTVVACGSGAPGGIFAPALILGASLGYLIGDLAQLLSLWVGIPLGLSPDIGSTSTYALAGMGAFFSAVTKGPITAIVIVFEMTTDFNLVLPLMISSVIASLVADQLFEGSLYNRLLMLKGVRIGALAENRSHQLTELTAADLMQRRVETLSSQMSLAEAIQAFSRSHHRGFPVVDHGRLVGIISQSDVGDSSRYAPGSEHTTTLADIMTPQPVTVKAHDPLTHVLYLLNRFKISRLPVVDAHKLVGIITRADIIRAESDQLSGENQQFGPVAEPSYMVYQTQAPATGQGRILVLLHNPQTAEVLLRIAGAIAQDRNYELECLQVITVSCSQPPNQTAIKTTLPRRTLRRAQQFGEKHNIPVHTQIRIAHDVAQAVLETIKQRHIDVAIMGWRGNTVAPGRVFGDVVDTIIRQAPCEVLVVKRGKNPRFNRWLVPVAGGPNAKQAFGMIPSLVRLGTSPEVNVCQVFPTIEAAAGTTALNDSVQDLEYRLVCPVLAKPLWGTQIADGVITLAWKERTEVLLIGASREGLLQQAIKGNIPEAIARKSDCTVILFRGADSKTPLP